MTGFNKQLKILFNLLQRNSNSILLRIKKLKKSNYAKDNEFGKLFNSVNYTFFDEHKNVSLKTSFAEKNYEIDRSTLYSFHGPLQLLLADVAYLEFLEKSTTDQKYCLIIVDLFSSKTYVYPMKSRKSITNKLETFYKEIKIREKKVKR